MTNTLKPCPFCGGEGLELNHAPTYLKEHPDVYWVLCFDCGARGSEEWTTQLAIEAWNTRADSEESEYYNGYEQLMNRCADLTNLCRDMYETMHYLDPRHVYEYYTKRMEELGLLEVSE